MEKDVYKRYLDGDDTALMEIIREYKDGLTMYLNNYVHDLNVADDLCCETFLCLADKKPVFRANSSFKTFLYGIGRKTALMYIRRNKKYTAEPLEYAAEIADSFDPEEEYLIKERNRQLYAAMKKLKSEHSQVLWLVYFEDLSNKDIAAVMKKSLSAVKMLLHRARLALKAELEKEGFEYENS